MSEQHELKAWPMYAEALASGVKTFEFRKDDRTPRYEAGDTLWLREWWPPELSETPGFTGREWRRLVTYVARGFHIPEGYCVMAIVPATPHPAAALGDGETVDRALRFFAVAIKSGESWTATCQETLDEARTALLELDGKAGWHESERATYEEYTRHLEARLRTVEAERERLRAQIDRQRVEIEKLPRFDPATGGCCDADMMRFREGEWILRDDVLAALASPPTPAEATPPDGRRAE